MLLAKHACASRLIMVLYEPDKPFLILKIRGQVQVHVESRRH